MRIFPRIILFTLILTSISPPAAGDTNRNENRDVQQPTFGYNSPEGKAHYKAR